jgi:glycosyltransferase involved in cell wall biosynthesis
VGKSIKILILAPWFRTLAIKHAQVLVGLGHEVEVWTTNRQQDRLLFEREPELVIRMFKSEVLYPGSARFLFKECVTLVKQRPDIVLLDWHWDPRFIFAFLFGQAKFLLVHDDYPHDAAHALPPGKNALQTLCLLIPRSGSICFSNFVARRLTRRRFFGNKSVHVLPLVSEAPWGVAPTHDSDKRFVFLGRFSPYKGLEILLAAWSDFIETHPTWVLEVRGSGEYSGELPRGVELFSGHYSDDEAITSLSRAAAVVLPYISATQSGVQVLANQLGRPTIVSDAGALPEFQLDKNLSFIAGDNRDLLRVLAVAARNYETSGSCWSEEHLNEFDQLDSLASKFSSIFGKVA